MRYTCSGVSLPIDFCLDVCKLLVVPYKMKLGPAQPPNSCRDRTLSAELLVSGRMLNHSAAVEPPGPHRQHWCSEDCKLKVRAIRIFICFVRSSLLASPCEACSPSSLQRLCA